MHGATYVVDVCFMGETLTADGIVADIGRALGVVGDALAPLRYENVDAIEEFSNRTTTTEFLCRWVFDRIADAARRGDLGPGSESVERIRVTLNESHVARAWYEGAV